MNRRSLGMLAIVLIVLMAMVATAGLDKLPRELRASVQTTTEQVQTDRSRFQANRAAVESAVAAEAALFAVRAPVWRERLNQAEARLREAETQAASLRTLADENRREDRDKVEQGLQKLRAARAGALDESEQIRQDAERWLAYKRDLPERLTQMRNNYETLQAWDAAAATSAAQKAMVDWPGKRDDLQQRIDRLAETKKAGEAAWESTAGERTAAEAQNSTVDYAALFTAGDRLENSVKQVSEGAATVNALAQQLYVDRNKVLLELDGETRQKVRVVETRFSDGAMKDGTTSEQERWEEIDAARFQQVADKSGMVIERKPAGKYDSEAERTAQAPAYAYVAPPGQANQYGSWSNGVWSWLPQYLILSQLLRGSQYPPITAGDYRDYDQARRRGDVWYGRDNRYRGSSGGRWSNRGSGARRTLEYLSRSARNSRGWYQERSPGGTPSASGSGGFSGSRYRSRGTFSGSRYQSRGGGFGSRSYSRGFGRSLGRSFGRGRR
jgi:hypothetical protein